MGLLDRFTGASKKEKTKIVDGYEIDIDSGTILHCPKGLSRYVLPKEAKRLSNEACLDMAPTMEIMEVPSSFSEFTGQLIALKNAKKLNEVHFAEGIKQINSKLFSDNVSYNVPNSVTHLGAGLYMPSNDGKLIIGNHITSIEMGFASHDLSLQHVEIPGSIQSIPKYAFNQCKNIHTVIIQPGVKKCENEAFRGTNKLKLVEIPDGFSGYFDASMESRSGVTTRAGKTYRYDSSDYDKNANSKLTIRVTRGGQKYVFQIRRGDFNRLKIDENIIRFNDGNLECDMSKLNSSDIHTITEGKIIIEETQKSKKEQFRDSIHCDTPTQSNPTSQPKSFLQRFKEAEKLVPHIIAKSKVATLSTDDRYLLAMALNLKLQYAQRQWDRDMNNETLLNRLNNIENAIEKLEDDNVIPLYSTLKAENKKKSGYWDKKFDEAVKQLEESQR